MRAAFAVFVLVSGAFVLGAALGTLLRRLGQS